MNTQLTVKQERVSALNLMGARLNVDPIKLMATLKATVFKNATDDELLALVVVSNEYRLNPLTKEIYAFPAKGGGIVPVVSIDGWVSMVNHHQAMDGMEFEEIYEEGKLTATTCKLWRKDRSRPIAVTEHLSECKRNTEPWKMEHRMLRHKALMQCARYAFGFSGVTDEDEAAETHGMRNVTPARSGTVNPYAEPDTATPNTFADLKGAIPEEPQAAPEPEAPVQDDAGERALLIAEIRKAIKPTECSTPATFAPRCREAGLLEVGVQLAACPLEDLRTIAANAADIAEGNYIPIN